MLGSRLAEVVQVWWRGKRRKRLLLKEGVLTFFPVMFLRNLVPWMIWEVSGDLGTTFAVTLVVFRMPALSSGVLVATVVSDSRSSVSVLGVALLSRSDCGIQKATSVFCGKSRRHEI